jgi:catalase
MPLFGHPSGTVVARFSNFSGEKERDDQRRTVHGLALELQASGEASFVMVMVDIRRFPVATREDFVALTRCLRSVGPRRWWSTAKLIVTGRTSLVALFDSRVRRRVSSYAEQTYNGLNAFYCELDEKDADQVPVRYLATPTPSAERAVIRQPSVALPRTRLDDELHARLRTGTPVRFDIELVLGRRRNGENVSPDRARDPTHAWSTHSPRLRLCTISLDRYIAIEGSDRYLFQPFDVPDGIQPSVDEILSARRTAYAASYLRRCPLDEVVP